MITQEEYLNAVNVIAEFQKQIQRDLCKLDTYKKIDRKTTPKEWDKWNDCSGRLKTTLNILFSEDTSYNRFKDTTIVYPPKFNAIEDVTKIELVSVRNAGIGTWNEFIDLRGY